MPAANTRPHFRTLNDLANSQCATHADRPFVTSAGETLDYAEFGNAVAAWRAWLAEEGIARGDRVATLLSNSCLPPILLFAITDLGAIYVPLNVHHKGAVLQRMLQDCEPSLVIAEERHLRVGAADSPSSVSRVALVDAGSRHLPSVLHGTKQARPAADCLPVDAAHPSDAAAILYTSGTSGDTKGVVCSHAFLIHFARSLATALAAAEEDAVYSCLPQFHSSGLISGTLLAFCSGSSVAIDERFSRARFWRRICETRATIVLMVGGMPSLLESLPQTGDERAHALRVIVAIPAPAAQVERLEERYGVPVMQNYGSTEMGFVTEQRPEERTIGSVGKPASHVELLIADDDGFAVRRGDVGEILVRPRLPETIFTGYWRRPETTAEAFRGLWFRTRDAAYEDADGNVWFVDRKQDVIRRRGEHVSAAELEAVAAEYTGVADCCAIGVPSELGEQDVCLAVIPQRDVALDPSSLFEFLYERVAYFMVPRYVWLLDGFPRTASHKVQKELLRKRFARVTAVWDADREGLRATPRGIVRT